ncbi:MAG: hypothetical protein ICV84_05535 [Flavisolibacter sp.]|nr:hypothetical protein [Flavisolibacter sp.]
MRWASYLLMIVLFSCSPYSGLRRQAFQYTNDNQHHTIRVVVPKGYSRSHSGVDSVGNQTLFYYFPNGALLYFARLSGNTEIQPFDTTNNIPRQHPIGGVIYKGMNEKGLFWREIRIRSFRFGYRNVSSEQELAFDSATNFASILKPVH